VDYSRASDGYVMIKYDGSNTKVKVQISFAGQDPYTYDLVVNADFQAFPLSSGSGSYEVSVFLNVGGDKYSTAAAQSFDAMLADDFGPFLRPNQYSYFTAASAAVAKSAEISKGSKSDLDVVGKVFDFVIKKVSYDYDKAENVQSGYIPNVDETLSTGKGICFDYASLMTCMLRAQQIPCKLVVGYAGEAYHAWIDAYVEGVGWVDKIVEFNGANWYFMDPTFASTGDKADPNTVGDGTNYNPIYYY
jgi:transglutaminase-like putative cysteine protease